MARREHRMPREEKQFNERVVSIDRVARVVKGGRRFRFRALVVVGDRKGKVGAGTAKGADVTAAVSKATEVAKKKMIVAPMHNGTIPHEQQAKISGAKILLKPAAPGTGLIAGGVVRIVLEVAGIKDILSKSLGSSNKINVAYATLEALRQIKPKSEWLRVEKTKKTSSKKEVASKTKPTASTKPTSTVDQKEKK